LYITLAGAATNKFPIKDARYCTGYGKNIFSYDFYHLLILQYHTEQVWNFYIIQGLRRINYPL